MLSLYIHIPFCVTKCHYCGFYSTIYSPKNGDEFISGFQKEIEQQRRVSTGETVGTVYLGGGTPSVLSVHQFERLLTLVNQNFRISAAAEYTMEANPNSLSNDHLVLFKRMGGNRLSLGIQSFSPDLLRFLGRSHTAKQGTEAFRAARRAGFDNIGIDLIYGIPGQADDEWSATLSRAVELGPEHISAYGLSVDDGSRFKTEMEQGSFSLPDDETVAGQYRLAVSELGKAGYEQYEISNFSLPGFSCRHNLNYWNRGWYLGLGPAASSFINNTRFNSVADFSDYCRRLKSGLPVIKEEEVVDGVKGAHETVMLALRTTRGIDLERYEKEYGHEKARLLAEKAVPLERTGLLRETEGRLTLTQNGFLLANEVIERLIS